MAILNMTAVVEALKSFYLPRLRYQLNDRASIFLSQIERDTESVVGKDIVMALRYGRVGGIGNRADDGDLPVPNSRKTKQGKWETKNAFARFQITDKTIKASRTNVGAFANMLEQEISDCETDAKLDLSRQAVEDGIGKLATISAATHNAGTTTLTVDDIIYFSEGMLVDIVDDSQTPDAILANGSQLEITKVDEVNSQIDVADANDISASIEANQDWLCLHGNFVVGGRELTGLRAVMENASLYGLTRATYPWLNATRINVNGEISEPIIQRAIDDSERKAGGNINYLICSYGVRRAYQALLTAQKQIVNTMELKGGWTTLSYNGKPLAADKYIRSGRLYCLDLEDWKFYQMSDYEWMDEDGAMLCRVANKPAWEATLVKYADLGCQKPRAQVELYGITEH